ncbi:Uncharacterised protein [Bacteroides xylanisolvens]|nr:Uncharacterised protein [Bacteroides xylanisolvens]
MDLILPFKESLTARRAQHRPAAQHDPAHRRRSHRRDVFIQKSCIATLNAIYLGVHGKRGPDNASHSCIHALCITAAGQYSQSFHKSTSLGKWVEGSRFKVQGSGFRVNEKTEKNLHLYADNANTRAPLSRSPFPMRGRLLS